MGTGLWGGGGGGSVVPMSHVKFQKLSHVSVTKKSLCNPSNLGNFPCDNFRNL